MFLRMSALTASGNVSTPLLLSFGWSLANFAPLVVHRANSASIAVWTSLVNDAPKAVIEASR